MHCDSRSLESLCAAMVTHGISEPGTYCRTLLSTRPLRQNSTLNMCALLSALLVPIDTDID